jgi:hypothetical protein
MCILWMQGTPSIFEINSSNYTSRMETLFHPLMESNNLVSQSSSVAQKQLCLKESRSTKVYHSSERLVYPLAKKPKKKTHVRKDISSGPTQTTTACSNMSTRTKIGKTSPSGATRPKFDSCLGRPNTPHGHPSHPLAHL